MTQGQIFGKRSQWYKVEFLVDLVTEVFRVISVCCSTFSQCINHEYGPCFDTCLKYLVLPFFPSECLSEISLLIWHWTLIYWYKSLLLEQNKIIIAVISVLCCKWILLESRINTMEYSLFFTLWIVYLF